VRGRSAKGVGTNVKREGVRVAEATIRDVARRADVSIASVSRTLNAPATVHPDTRERVLKAIAELRYVPHAGARSLSMRSCHAIGAVLPDLHGEFFSELVRGMDRKASALGYQLLLSTIHDEPWLAGQALRAMRGRVDGIVVMAPQLDPASLETVLPSLPVVLVNCVAENARPSLRIDNAGGVAAVIAHFVESGRRRIVHVAGPSANVDARERKEAYCATLAKLAPEVEPIVFEGNFLEQSGSDAVEWLAAEGTGYDALFAASDMMALGAIGALRARGIAVPGDVSVAGFDDIPLARFLGVTTVAVRMDELGSLAIARLVAELRGEQASPQVELIYPTLVVRESSEGQG
jgi:LacI family transcriptional regulator